MSETLFFHNLRIQSIVVLSFLFECSIVPVDLLSQVISIQVGLPLLKALLIKITDVLCHKLVLHEQSTFMSLVIVKITPCLLL